MYFASSISLFYFRNIPKLKELNFTGEKKVMSNQNNEKPGEGIRSMRSSTAFRVINFELYAKPVSYF